MSSHTYLNLWCVGVLLVSSSELHMNKIPHNWLPRTTIMRLVGDYVQLATLHLTRWPKHIWQPTHHASYMVANHQYTIVTCHQQPTYEIVQMFLDGRQFHMLLPTSHTLMVVGYYPAICVHLQHYHVQPTTHLMWHWQLTTQHNGSSLVHETYQSTNHNRQLTTQMMWRWKPTNKRNGISTFGRPTKQELAMAFNNLVNTTYQATKSSRPLGQHGIGWLPP